MGVIQEVVVAKVVAIFQDWLSNLLKKNKFYMNMICHFIFKKITPSKKAENRKIKLLEKERSGSETDVT